MDEIILNLALNFPMIPEHRVFEICSNNLELGLDYIIELLKYEANSDRKGMKVFENEEKFTVRCSVPGCADRNCFRYHNIMQKRRPVELLKYQPKPCFNVYRNEKWGNPEICPKGESCEYCHTENELIHHINPFIPVVKTVNQNLVVADRDDMRIFSGNVKLNSEIVLLKEKIEALKQEIRAREQDVRLKSSQVPKVEEKIQSLKSILLCSLCNFNFFEYIAVPCGHVLCSECARIEKCSKCDIYIQLIKAAIN